MTSHRGWCSVAAAARALRATCLRAVWSVTVLALAARVAAAQLTYNRTVFIPGLNDPVRWSQQNSAGKIGQVINLGANGGITPSAADPSQTVDAQALSIRNGWFSSNTGRNVLVGHSLGGEVARDLFLSSDPSINVASQVAGILTVASPNFGAPIEVAAHTRDPLTAGDVVNGFFDHIGNVLNPGGLIGALASAVVGAFINNVIFNTIKQGIAQAAGANTPGALDLLPSSATMQRLSTATDNLPHVALYGSIPRRDAVYYLWSGMNWGDGRSAVHNKNVAQGVLRTCRHIFYNIIIHTALGRVCYLGDRALSGVDDVWWRWTHQGGDQNATFDGFLPADYTRYPGTTLNAPTNINVVGENHFTITFHDNGLSGVETGMQAIGMTKVGAGTGGCGEATCVSVQAAYISHFTGANCTGTESYYTPYFGNDGIRRSWDGGGIAGTTIRSVTNRSYKTSDGTCSNAWPNGNTLSGFVTIYRGGTVGGDVTPPIVTASPAGGVYGAAQTVTLSANESATIFYTVDGSTPTTSSTQYTGPLTISSTTTLRYFGNDLANNVSAPASQTYTINVSGPTCGEANCVLVQAAYISHFTGANCTGTESYYTPYFGNDGIRRSWDGGGIAGTTLRTVTNVSYKTSDGTCNNAWPAGNTLDGFVTIYR